MKTILITILVVMLSGCATTKDMQEVITESKTHKQYAFPSENDMSKCAGLPTLKGKTKADLLAWRDASINTLQKCEDKRFELAEWINRFKEEIK